MNPALAQREIALAGVALLAAVAALALSSRDAGQARDPSRPRPAAEWYDALAAPGGGPYGRHSACGYLIRRDSRGVGHPVLPCGAKIFIAFDGKQVLTEIIARGPTAPGQQFELTPALAKELDLSGVQPIRWTFART